MDCSFEVILSSDGAFTELRVFRCPAGEASGPPTKLTKLLLGNCPASAPEDAAIVLESGSIMACLIKLDDLNALESWVFDFIKSLGESEPVALALSKQVAELGQHQAGHAEGADVSQPNFQVRLWRQDLYTVISVYKTSKSNGLYRAYNLANAYFEECVGDDVLEFLRLTLEQQIGDERYIEIHGLEELEEWLIDLIDQITSEEGAAEEAAYQLTSKVRKEIAALN